jgi:hypothetical protein
MSECRGRMIGWWNCGCDKCKPGGVSTLDGGPSLTERFRLAIRTLIGMAGEKPKVYAEDLHALGDVLVTLVTLQAAEESEKPDYTPELIDVDGLFKHIEDARIRRAALFPTEESAMAVMQLAVARLRDLGWESIEYSPKDGSTFKGYEVGAPRASTLIYLGEWPEGGWFASEGGDLYPSYPGLFKKRPQ